MIEIKNVTFSYKKKQELLSNFSLNIASGKIYGLLGKNGAGKSTLLYLMSGLLYPQQGNVLLDKEEVSKRLPTTLREIFIVPEEFDLPPMSLARYVKINSPFYPKFSMTDMERYLQCFEMKSDLHLKSLSMGEKKKVFMSFALATNTSLLLMDEPSNGLDIPSKSQFRKFMALGMTDSKTIIISTHQVQDVDKMLDHIIVVDENQVILNESVASITNKLSFVEGAKGIDPQDILYVLPTVKGNSMIIENKTGDETPLNIELLYNALLSNKTAMSQLFITKTQENGK